MVESMTFRAGIAAALWWGIGCSCLAADDAPAEPAPAGEQAAATPQPTSDEYYELMRVFVDTFEQIDRNYVKSVDRRELMEAALRGMLSKLDPYSDYIGPSDLEHFTEAVEQEFGGIGIQVDWDGRVVWRFPIGKYSPGIATERAYYFTLNGILVAFRGRNGPR